MASNDNNEIIELTNPPSTMTSQSIEITNPPSKVTSQSTSQITTKTPQTITQFSSKQIPQTQAPNSIEMRMHKLGDLKEVLRKINQKRSMIQSASFSYEKLKQQYEKQASYMNSLTQQINAHVQTIGIILLLCKIFLIN